MELTIKNLQGKVFKISDVEEEDTVASLKQKIAGQFQHPVELQKLIYSGKILQDDAQIKSYNIKQTDFIVLMVSKPKAAPAPAAAPAPVAAKAPEATPATAPAPAPAAPVAATSTSAASSTSAPATASPAAATPQERAFGDTTSFLSGDALQASIQNMIEMGFERAQVMRAMKASFNNPDRAVEYLMNGIPAHLDAESSAGPAGPAAPGAPATNPAPAPQQTAAPAPVPAAAPAQPAAAPAPQPTAPQNLFQLAQQQQQHHGGGLPGGAAGLGATGAGIESLGGGDAQLGQFRNTVMQNPALLQPMIQQIAQSNPNLAQYLEQNPEALLQLLGAIGGEGGLEEGEGGEGGIPPGATVLQVTPEERAAIERLEALGFPRQQVVEAYFACDKNEEMAANYLFENGFEDE
ncbi:UV excision repair protein Rad23 [Fomitiporia mediterranea MF3/22]|uniref:UV excision repair protein Rad23 n=1 Tax=Fomitiporia mediterranea (strain MF3/22) TaxID=694068 RepID=UPI0004408A7B|nr:UV excision repair protein Rad23 [Fomitiporia mediterranea MF3/22]EJD03021.1 UV excision repair protein Rad23 [Fomitiporia mediterranea MF3/22]